MRSKIVHLIIAVVVVVFVAQGYAVASSVNLGKVKIDTSSIEGWSNIILDNNSVSDFAQKMFVGKYKTLAIYMPNEDYKNDVKTNSLKFTRVARVSIFKDSINYYITGKSFIKYKNKILGVYKSNLDDVINKHSFSTQEKLLSSIYGKETTISVTGMVPLGVWRDDDSSFGVGFITIAAFAIGNDKYKDFSIICQSNVIVKNRLLSIEVVSDYTGESDYVWARSISSEDPAAETAGRQKTMDVPLWQRPQGVK